MTHRAQVVPAAHSWPGNVHELENVLGHACMMAAGESIDVQDLPAYLHPAPGAGHLVAPSDSEVDALEEQERLLVLRAMEKAGGNQSEAARILRIGRDALRYKLKKFGIGSAVQAQPE